MSASLMSVFFILLGVTVGVFVGSFLLGNRKIISLWIPSIIASAMTLLMYIGEMILLNGHLYSFGTGFMFNSISGIVLAPIDVIVGGRVTDVKLLQPSKVLSGIFLIPDPITAVFK